MAISNIDINGHTYTDAMWRADWEGTISAIANDIASVVAAKDLVGTLHKAVSGSITLTGPESMNLGFVFTGALGTTINVNFAAGFEGPATVVNATTGGQIISCGLASGARAEIIGGEIGVIMCDGANIYLASGTVHTATGVKLVGTVANFTGTIASFSGTVTAAALHVTGAAAIDGVMTVNSITSSGGMSIGGGINVTGNSGITGNLDVTGYTHVTGQVVADSFSSIHDSSVTGNLVVGGYIHSTGQTLAHDLSVSTTASITGTLIVGGDTTFNGATNTFANGAGEIRVVIRSKDGASSAWQQYQSGPGTTSTRWLVGKNGDPETGGNAGSVYEIAGFTDSGDAIGSFIRIYRDTHCIQFPDYPTSPAGLPSGGIWVDLTADNVLKMA